MRTKRNRTPSEYLGYGIYQYFLSLSYRNTSKALSKLVKRSHVAIWKWIQKYKPKKLTGKGREVSKLVVDETIVKIGSNCMRVWVAIESKSKEVIKIGVSLEQNMLGAEHLFHQQ